MRAKIGEKFSESLTLTPEETKAFSRAARDFNPLHHDEEIAANSRYKRLIASGTQTGAHLMALPATYFSRRYDVVGLDFSLRFHKPVYADETIHLEWEVVDVTPMSSNTADVVEMKGRVTNSNGDLAIAATGRVMVADKL